MADTLQVRALEAGDYRAWSKLWGEHIAGLGRGETALDTRKRFEEMVKGAAHTLHGVIAERNGEPVGVAHFRRPRTKAEVGDLSLLHDMYVVPGAASDGVAYALTEAQPLTPTGNVRSLITNTLWGRKAA
ncbi:MAG: GNAT family N-acetyltransferase [Shimia sp.]